MGRYSAGKPDVSGIRPGDVPRLRSSARHLRAARHDVLIVLGTIAAMIVVIGVARAVLGGGGAGDRPAGQVAAPSRALSAGSPSPSSPSPSATAAASPAATAFPSARASAQNAQALAASLAPLPESTGLSGSAAIAWADAALTALGAPLTAANVHTMVDWFANEGTPHDLNNPLNLQTPYGGSTVSTADGDPPSDGIQAYPKPADFVAAFPLEMHEGSYPAIVAALKAGRGLEGSAATPEIASELSVYSGDGYNSIPAS